MKEWITALGLKETMGDGEKEPRVRSGEVSRWLELRLGFSI